MAEEELELKKTSENAQRKENTYEEMNNEELCFTPICIQTQMPPNFALSILAILTLLLGI